MSYKVAEEGNITTIHLDGEIDMMLKRQRSYFSTIESGKEVHLNLSNKYMIHQVYLF